MKKQLREYDLSEAVVLADHMMAGLFDMTDMLFAARKYELLHNCTFIVKMLKLRAAGDERMALVIDSDRWETRDIYTILTVVKNYYKQIDIIMLAENAELSRLSELMYDEWGMVINIYKYNDHDAALNDMVFFLVKNEDRLYSFWKRNVKYLAAYVVAEQRCVDNRYSCNSNVKMPDMYSGLVYETCELGVNMAYQKPLIYEKFHVSSIDICEL